MVERPWRFDSSGVRKNVEVRVLSPVPMLESGRPGSSPSSSTCLFVYGVVMELVNRALCESGLGGFDSRTTPQSISFV